MPQLAASFQDPDVAAAYVHRPPYPVEVFDVLESLMSGPPRRILDLGAGRRRDPLLVRRHGRAAAMQSRTRSSPYRKWSSRLRCGWRASIVILVKIGYSPLFSSSWTYG